VSDIEVECTSPENSGEEIVEFSLVWGAVGAQTSNAVKYMYHTRVAIVQLLPTRGPTAGEGLVTVVGTGFRQQGLLLRMGASMVRRSGVMWVSSTQVMLTAPARNGTGNVAVVEASVNDGADFTSNGKEYLYEAGATVGALLPSRGSQGKAGQVVTVVGRHFAKSGELSCRFGDSMATTGLYMSSTMVECMAPLRDAGAVMVSVSNNGRDAGPSDMYFEYEAWMGAVLRAMPSAGPVRGGTRTMVKVSGQQEEAGSLWCKFGATVSEAREWMPRRCNVSPLGWSKKALWL